MGMQGREERGGVEGRLNLTRLALGSSSKNHLEMVSKRKRMQQRTRRAHVVRLVPLETGRIIHTPLLLLPVF